MNRCHLFLLFIIVAVLSSPDPAKAQLSPDNSVAAPVDIFPADVNMDSYLPLLKGKRVALLINQSSLVGDKLLLDTLLDHKIKIVKIFAPEHGFRGTEDAGAKVFNTIDTPTHIPVISLYGANKKPSKAQLANVDVVVYDIQDVGVRFFTYIATLQYAMEACAENGKKFIILDRPDPNGFYVDGPVLDTAYRSFVGMQPVPIVYGMTVGEYAKMLVGEHWFKSAKKLDLKIIPCTGYDHTKKYVPSVQPSPNLKGMAGIYSYPVTGLFEGTVMSVGRGTTTPFQLWGHPSFYGKFIYSFTPRSMFGAAHPLYEDRDCYGEIVAINGQEALFILKNKVLVIWLQKAYKAYEQKSEFFNGLFDKLAGNKELKQQIIAGTSEWDIYKSWEKGLDKFKKIRKKYLLYTDFEK